MIRRIDGKTVDKTVDSLLIDCGGLGYNVWTTPENLSKIKVNQPLVMWTHHVFREDSQDLYGFLDKEDLGFFKLLITVSGIGPKTALSIMTIASVETLYQGIVSGDSAYLTKISGMGKKTAEKIVFELSGKIEAIVGEGKNPLNQEGHDVIEALQTLGYGEREIRDVLKKLDNTISAEKQIKAALVFLSKTSK